MLFAQKGLFTVTRIINLFIDCLIALQEGNREITANSNILKGNFYIDTLLYRHGFFSSLRLSSLSGSNNESIVAHNQ